MMQMMECHRNALADFPNEVLACIFKYIPFMECEKIMQVSIRWRSVIDELVGIRAYIGKPSEFWSEPLQTWHEFPKIASVGTSTVSFSDLDERHKDVTQEIPSFKHPHLVRRVSFDGYLRQGTLTHLLERIWNLAYLELHLSSLEYIDLSCVNLNFPKLQELIISSNNYTLEHMIRANLGQIMVNCTKLLESPFFPRLLTLRLYIPIVVQRSKSLLRALLKFLLRHNATMTTFLIRTEVTVSLVAEDPTSTEPPEPVDMSPEVTLSKAHKLPLPVFRATFCAGDFQFLEFFRGILNQQKEMTWCGFITHDDFRPFPQHLVKQNSMTLRKLHLSVGVVDALGNGITMDCGYLQDCESLQHIGFVGNRTKGNSLGVITPDLINAHLLPRSLKFVEIYNILIDKGDVHLMALHLPHLQTLHLENIGERGNLGMTVETLVNVIVENRVRKIGVLAGFNEESLRQSSSNDNPTVRMTRLLLGKEVAPTFIATLQTDGHVEWGYTEDDEKFL